MSCSTVEPIPKPSPHARFFDPQPKDAQGNETIECPQGADSKNYPSCFYNGLGTTVDAMVKRRDELAALARQSVNDTALFNAVLPPAGAVVTYRRLRELPHSGLLLPATVAAAFYGLLNSRIPDLHKHYLRTAREVQCSTVRHAMWLYRTDEIVGEVDAVALSYRTRSVVEKEGMASSSDLEFRMRAYPPAKQPLRAMAPSLQRLTDELDAAIEAYSRGRSRVIGGLQAPAAPAAASDAFQRAQGKGGGARQADTRQRIKQVTLDRLNVAIALREDLHRCPRQGTTEPPCQLNLEPGWKPSLRAPAWG